MRIRRASIVTVYLLLLLCLGAPAVSAGVINFTVVEDKGLFIIVQPALLIIPDVLTIIPPAPDPIVNRIVPSVEQILLVSTVRLLNITSQSIEIPQPLTLPQVIDIFWFMSADSGAGPGPLPGGSSLQSASLIGPRTGTVFPATITPIANLASLPTSSAHDLAIQWNLSALTQTTGNFFLASASIPVSEFVPEPASGILCLIGLVVGAAAYARQRSRGRVHQSKSFYSALRDHRSGL